jgi:hypothetical protein
VASVEGVLVRGGILAGRDPGDDPAIFDLLPGAPEA